MYLLVHFQLDTNNSLHKDKQLLTFKMIDFIALSHISENHNRERQIIYPTKFWIAPLQARKKSWPHASSLKLIIWLIAKSISNTSQTGWQQIFWSATKCLNVYKQHDYRGTIFLDIIFVYTWLKNAKKGSEKLSTL